MQDIAYHRDLIVDRQPDMPRSMPRQSPDPQPRLHLVAIPDKLKPVPGHLQHSPRRMILIPPELRLGPRQANPRALIAPGQIAAPVIAMQMGKDHRTHIGLGNPQTRQPPRHTSLRPARSGIDQNRSPPLAQQHISLHRQHNRLGQNRPTRIGEQLAPEPDHPVVQTDQLAPSPAKTVARNPHHITR